jgi:hypothetical protein
MRLASYIFHPLFTVVLATLFFFFFNSDSFSWFQINLIIFLNSIITIAIPLACYFLLKSMKKIETPMATNIDERKIPLLINIFLLIVLAKNSIKTNNLEALHFFLLGGIVSTVLCFGLLYVNIKASLHLVGTASLLAFIIGLSIHNQINAVLLLAILVLVNGWVASSRLYMVAHSNFELVIGFAIGFLSQLFFYNFWL